MNPSTKPTNTAPKAATPAPAKPAAPARPAATATTLKLTDVQRDPKINCRVDGVNERVAAEYAEAANAGAKFPPVAVFRDADGKLWLADGFHRCRAVELAGGAEVVADVREGDRRAALLYAAGANASHGARRTNKDKRCAVLALLADPEWVKSSDRWIAERASVNHELVGTLRKLLAESASSPRTGKDGKVRKVPKRKARRRKPNPSRAVKAARRGLDRVARGWPKGEPLGPLVETGKAWLESLGGAS